MMRTRSKLTANYFFAISCAIAFLGVAESSRAGVLVFDSFNGDIQGGFSGANNGIATQISVSQTVTLSNIAVLNNLTVVGQFTFDIFDATNRVLLLETTPMQFDPDFGTTPTWKTSPNLSFTLLAGRHYAIGYASNVDRAFDVYDSVSESQNGITSDMKVWGSTGFNPTKNAIPILNGGDFAIRLYAVPEPHSRTLIAVGVATLVFVVIAKRAAKVGRIVKKV